MEGSGPPSNTWFIGHTRVLNPNGISIGAAMFAGFTCVTDRPTNHATRSVTVGRIYLCNAMQPDNFNLRIKSYWKTWCLNFWVCTN